MILIIFFIGSANAIHSLDRERLLYVSSELIIIFATVFLPDLALPEIAILYIYCLTTVAVEIIERS
jgi:hypothetical protein